MVTPPDLLEQALTGELDPQQTAAAQALLAADPERAAEFVRQHRLGLALTALLRRRSGAEVAAGVRAVVAGRHSARRLVHQVRGRIERRQKTSSQHRWLMAGGVIAGGSLLLATAALLLVMIGGPSPVESNSVKATPPGELHSQTSVPTASADVAAGAELIEGTLLVDGVQLAPGVIGSRAERAEFVASGAGASLLLSDGTRLDLDPGSRLVLGHTAAGGRALTMHEGQIAAVVVPQPDGKPLELRGLHGTAVVRGTRLRLATSVTADRITLHHGAVEVVSAGGAPLTLHPGEVATCLANGTIHAAPLAGPPLLAWDFAAGLPPGSPWIRGEVVDNPAGMPAVACLSGVPLMARFRSWGVELRSAPQPLLRYDPDLLLCFRYWVSADLPVFKLWLGAGGPPAEHDLEWHELTVDHLTPGRWTAVALRLGDVRKDLRPGTPRLAPGTPLHDLQLNFEQRVAQRFFITDVRLALPAQR